MKRILVAASLALAAAVSFRCAAGPPPRQVAEARLALEDARGAGAERVAPREYDAARAHLAVAQANWEKRKDAESAIRWARVAEGEARHAQYIAEAQAGEEALRRETERRSHAELAVRDAEIALLQARARTEAEKRAAEAEARAAAERRAAQEELERRESAARESERVRLEAEARLTADQRRAEQENADRAQAERERLNAELEKTRAELEASRSAAEEARKAEAARQQSEEELRKTLAQLAQVREEARGLIVTLPGSIYFDVNKSDVKPAMRERLAEIARALATVPDRHILIEGHTDSDGPASYNLELSRLRAESVRSALVGGGVSPDRVETHGYGKTRPIASNATAAGKAQNRRVEIVLQGGAPAAAR